MAQDPNQSNEVPGTQAESSDALSPDISAALASAEAAVSQFSTEVGTDAAQPAAGDMFAAAGSDPEGIEMLGDVELDVVVELGRTEMLVEDVLRLTGGSVVELDKLAGDPVDVLVNQRLVARGEVLVLNDNFCIRISEIVDDLEEQAQDAAFGGAD